MNSDNLLQFVQTGFRVTLGATTSLVESIQDTQKREHNLALLQSDVNLLIQELAQKGEVTEQEARTFVDSILTPKNPASTQTTGSSSYTASTPSPVAPPDVQMDLQELTAQIAALRAELEKLRAQDNRP